ncbi:D-3-phosphoglycerate dehydrogenase [Halobacteroides halobius DSM 5150]|uniref:D-3-phosphoglycerate dehydrogenase n=1 Tax=Halobacteroides halobius (strain ATCC 35273 / DSM 5150 / MD-1) TaxID=748449 RepID=L0K6R0_HALHC|nr:phosphoglycerate dehydrogenase [Halobacteroides halobius]AGB40054.1 D-3-phosphoglycerate dehydrogenase [Halobacteroides halobius DSM 5150]
MRILVSDPLSQAGMDLLEENGVDVTYNTELSYDQLLEEIGNYDGILLRSMTPLNEEVLSQADNLKVIARAGSGYDNIDLDAASKEGIVVLNTPGENTISAAEQTMALMLAISRNTVQANQALHKGVWDRNKYMGVEVNDKTLGIIGLGRVGGEVAKRAKAFNMEVIANDPYIPEERGEKLGVELVSKDELYQRSDYVTIHTPLTDETDHIFNKETFAKMKDGVRIINAARGGCIDRFDLYDAVESGKVAAAGLDVHEEEPPGKDYNLLELEDKVILAPHLGGTTVAAMDNVAIEAAKQALMVLNGEPPRTPLNIPRLQPEEMVKLKPYIDLADNLGQFYAGWNEERIEEIEMIYEGQIAEYDLTPVTKGVLQGLLNPILDEEVNSVNAEMVAEERGIKVSQTTSNTSDDYSSLITLKVKSESQKKELSGTIFHDTPRIVAINGYDVDIVPQGTMLVTDHQDQPGIVGQVGTILGENEVNIASMQVGRDNAGGKAIMILNIDQEIDAQLKEKLLNINGMLDISILTVAD